MLARGSLGNPWVFEELLGRRDGDPTPAEALAELDWVMDRAAEHLGEERAARYLRKFYPWYTRWLGGGHELNDALQRSATLIEARGLLHAGALPRAA